MSIIAALALASALSPQASPDPYAGEMTAQFREARFGMFYPMGRVQRSRRSV